MTETLREALVREADAVPVPELFGPALRARARPRRWRWVALSTAAVTAAAAAAVVLAWPSSEHVTLPGGESAQPLLDAADRAAKNNGGEAVNVEAVKSTRGEAADYTGHPNDDLDRVVWVVQVSGSHYTCRYCKGPAGLTPIGGDYITLVLTDGSWQSTDSGIGPQPSDLRKLGEIDVLRGTSVASDRAAFIERCTGGTKPDYTTEPTYSPQEFLGLTEDAARALAAEQKQAGLRVIGRDGECLGMELDLRPTRVNVVLEDGEVIWSGRF